jgi:hypothetical protein
MEVFHDETTMFKVREALVRVGGERMADNAIIELLNAGILFREYAPEEPQDLECDVETAAAPMSSEDPWFRQRCLELAIQNSTPGMKNPSVLALAKQFEAYLKGEDK